MQPEHLQKIMGYYVEDAKDHLNTIEQHLLNLQTTIEDPDIINELLLVRKAFREHLNGLVQRAHSTNLLEVAIISDMSNDLSTLEDLESLIDNLSLDSSSM